MDWSSDLEIYVPMRDGVQLSTDVYLPAGTDGKLPTVLVRTPYDKSRGPDAIQALFLKNGYAVVVQSERGRYFSEGHFGNYLQGASTDGYDTLDWIVNQPWSNGKVGTFGCSSTGEQQWPMAAGNHPGHAAMIPMASGTAIGDVPGNQTRGAFYRGGIPLMGIWAWWYGDVVPSERLELPSGSTREQRVRLRKSYSLQPKAQLRVPDNADAQWRHLPSQDILREIGGASAQFDSYITWGGPADPRWDSVEHIGSGDEPRVPALHINTWHDVGICETLRLFQHLQDLGTPNQHLIVGAGPHCSLTRELTSQLPLSELRRLSADPRQIDLERYPEYDLANLKFGDLEVGDARFRGGDLGFTQLFLDWFAFWLKGAKNSVTEMPAVQIFVMGQGWVSGDRWPLQETRQETLYLDRELLTRVAPSEESFDRYVYDPSIPVPTLGGGCCDFHTAAVDQRPVEIRRDVLVCSTPPLEEPVTIAGPIEVVLYVSSSAKDTDFIVKLVDVYPDGKAINLSDDGFRVRYRDGFDRIVHVQPSDVCRISLPNMVTPNRFQKGHRIRLDISSSNFPLYERNLNTGGDNYNETAWEVAENSVHRGGPYPSHVVLPVLA